jgi:hypothetical protein
MSANTDTSAWIATSSGMGKVRHMRRVAGGHQDRLAPVCSVVASRWRPLAEDEIASLPACPICSGAAERQVIRDLEHELRAVQYRLDYAAGLRETADGITRGRLPVSGPRLGPWSPLPSFADGEQKEAFYEAAREVRGWLRDAADALDPPEADR